VAAGEERASGVDHVWFMILCGKFLAGYTYPNGVPDQLQLRHVEHRLHEMGCDENHTAVELYLHLGRGGEPQQQWPN